MSGDFDSRVAVAGETPGDGGDDTIIGGEGDFDRAQGDNVDGMGDVSGDGGDDLISGVEHATGDNLSRLGDASGTGGDDVISGATGIVGDNFSQRGLFEPDPGLASGDGGNDVLTLAGGFFGSEKPIIIGDNRSLGPGPTAGTGGDDTIVGSDLFDRLIGDNENGGGDDISGHNGPDFLDGGPGVNDHCDGGLGKDEAVNCEAQIDIP